MSGTLSIGSTWGQKRCEAQLNDIFQEILYHPSGHCDFVLVSWSKVFARAFGSPIKGCREGTIGRRCQVNL